MQKKTNKKSSPKNVGKVYRGKTKYIDVDTKPERNYVVVKERKDNVTLAKLKSIKNVDGNNRNTDKKLVEINYKQYGLKKRTGVDYQRFENNRITQRPLRLDDKKVFPEQKERFKLSSHDLHRTLIYTGTTLKGKKKR